MGREHDSEPLVSPRGDGNDDEPASVARDEPADPGRAEAVGAEPAEPGRTEQVDAPRVDPAVEPVQPAPGASAPEAEPPSRPQSPNMLGAGRVRSRAERTFVRVIATGGIVGIGVAIAAIMSSSNSQGWLIGLVVSAVSVVLAAVLWSSRVL